MGLVPSSDPHNTYLAYCFDEAIMEFGNWVTGELEKIEGKNEGQRKRKREQRFKQIFASEIPESEKAKTFTDPAALLK